MPRKKKRRKYHRWLMEEHKQAILVDRLCKNSPRKFAMIMLQQKHVKAVKDMTREEKLAACIASVGRFGRSKLGTLDELRMGDGPLEDEFRRIVEKMVKSRRLNLLRIYDPAA